MFDVLGDQGAERAFGFGYDEGVVVEDINAKRSELLEPLISKGDPGFQYGFAPGLIGGGRDGRILIGAPTFHEFEVDDTPSGLDPDIGSEIDVVFGYEPSSSFELRLTGGWFRPGKALDADATPASVVRFQARFRF